MNPERVYSEDALKYRVTRVICLEEPSLTPSYLDYYLYNTAPRGLTVNSSLGQTQRNERILDTVCRSNRTVSLL